MQRQTGATRDRSLKSKHWIFALIAMLTIALYITIAQGPTTMAASQYVAINAGGGPTGNYKADAYFDQGNLYVRPAAVITTAGVSQPAPQGVYQSSRWASAFSYTITGLAAGMPYNVRLHWAELAWQANGQRKFNVAINDTAVLSSFDVFATVGYHKALVREFAATANKYGQVIIAFSQGGADNPFINGIEVIGSEGGTTTTTTAAATGTAVPATATDTAVTTTATDPAVAATATDTAVTTTPQTGRGFRSGLPWMSGVFSTTNMSAANTEAFCNWRGRACDTVNVFTTRNSWANITDPQDLYQSFAGWPGRFVLAQPMWPEKSGGSFNACASGAYDTQWQSFGKSLVQANRADTIVRIGWEMNGDWFEWSAKDPTGYINCFRKIATAIRSTDSKVLIDWTTNAHSSQSCNGASVNCYPGDEFVDVVGIDSYDWYPGSSNQSIWDSQCNGPEGMCTRAAFARQHNKLFGVGEWGVASGSGNNGAGDNPFYIQQMHQFFTKNTNVLLYENYFNFTGTPDTSIFDPSHNPNSAAAYSSLY